jgi:hypothetical protein
VLWAPTNRERYPFLVWQFFYILLKSILTNVKPNMILFFVISAGAAVVTHLGPLSYGFTCIQGILAAASSINSALEKDKDTFLFAMAPIVQSLPVSIIPWVESVWCSAFEIHYGGHLLYDLSLFYGTTAVYIAWYIYNVKTIKQD